MPQERFVSESMIAKPSKLTYDRPKHGKPVLAKLKEKRIKMADHDSPYKRLFSHPQMVRDLLEGFVHKDFINDCDFSSLEKCNSSFVSDEWQQRESDVIWRLKWKNGDWFYIYVLLEFQSSPDNFMALRMLGYTALFYQDLAAQQSYKTSFKLPAVLPIVIYNGSKAWHASTQLSDLFQPVPDELQPFQPQMQYFLLDENHCTPDELALKNLVSCVVKFEQSQDLDTYKALLDELENVLTQKTDSSSLARVFLEWLSRTLLSSKLGLEPQHLPLIENFAEGKIMLAENIERWKESLFNQGVEQGVLKGIEKGRNYGKVEGKLEGLREGKIEGELEGERKLLIKQLNRRFSDIPTWALEQINAADATLLETWALRLFDVDSIEALLA